MLFQCSDGACTHTEIQGCRRTQEQLLRIFQVRPGKLRIKKQGKEPHYGLPVRASPSELWELELEKALAQTGDSGVGLVLTPSGQIQSLIQMYGCSLRLIRK